MKYLSFFLLSTALLLAQSDSPGSLSYGFKIGSALNDPLTPNSFNVQSTFTQSRWTGGPTVELRLPFRFALEANALYWSKRTTSATTLRFESTNSPFSTAIAERTRAWDFPLLLKYRLPATSLIRPFVSVGYQFTHESRSRDVLTQCLGPTGSCTPPNLAIPDASLRQIKDSGFRHGPAAGAGLEFSTQHVTITPELRWTRHIDSLPRDNRFTAIVGFTFGRKR